MKRVVVGSLLAPTCFWEEPAFGEQEPYAIVIKRFSMDDTVIPHHATSAELIVSNGAEGYLQAENRRFLLSGRTAVYIPPGCVHSNVFKKGDGVVYVLKLFPKPLMPYLGVERILRACGSTLHCAPFVCNCPEKLEHALLHLIENDGHELICMQGLLRVLELLSPQMKAVPQEAPLISTHKNEYLKRLIAFTESHLTEGITNADAAGFIGYNLNYFCKWFRQMTGMTYTEYLMRLRISRACRMLEEGRSVRETAELLGYTNTSFFLKKFKAHMLCTPGEYRQRALSEHSSPEESNR